MLPLLPVDEADPVKRLAIVHERLVKLKHSGQREGASAVFAATQNIPFALSAWMIRLLTRLPQRSVTALATNIPGPRTRQRVMGREVLEILPIPPIGLHTHRHSYAQLRRPVLLRRHRRLRQRS